MRELRCLPSRGRRARGRPTRCSGGTGIGRLAGFTMIELMLVIGIIVMAAGIMAPTLTDFFKNRELDALSGQFGSIFSSARLQAVQRHRRMSVVFFREGPRVYDELSGTFTDDDSWNAKGSMLAKDPIRMWYALGFARGVSSYDERFDTKDFRPPPGLWVPPWEWWKERFMDSQGSQSKSKRRRSRKRGSPAAGPAKRLDVSNLYKFTYERDGTMTFGNGGADVPTTFFNALPGQGDAEQSPDKSKGGLPISDIVILQLDGAAANFMDLRATGQFKSKVSLLSKMPTEVGSTDSIQSSSSSRRSNKSRRRRR